LRNTTPLRRALPPDGIGDEVPALPKEVCPVDGTRPSGRDLQEALCPPGHSPVVCTHRDAVLRVHRAVVAPS
jgi:hypothetical protein